MRWRQVGVLGPLRFGRVQPARHPDRAVREDPPFHLAGGLLRADQYHPERAAPLGQVEQDLLDRAVAFAWRVLVELVNDDEHQRAGRTLPLLACELRPQRDAYDETLRPVRQVVQVYDRDLGARCADRALSAVGEIAADNDAQRRHRRAQPPEQGVDAARQRGAAHPRAAGRLVAELGLEQADEVAERPDDLVVGRIDVGDPDGTVRSRLDSIPAQPGGDLADQHRVLSPLVLGVGEHERQQLLFAEFSDGPEERAHRAVPSAHIRSP